MRKKIVAGLAAGFWASLLVASAPLQAAQYHIRWVIAHEPASVFERAAKRFADLVRADTHGAVDVQVMTRSEYQKEPLLTPAQVLAKVVSGEIEMSQGYTTMLGHYDERLWALDLPFLFRDHQHAAKVLEGPIGRSLLAGLASRNIHGLSFTYSGGFKMIHTMNREIRTLGDLRGLRIRTADSPVSLATFEALGAKPVSADVESINHLAKEGLIDGAETTFPRYWDQKQYEFSKNAVDTGHSLFLTMMVINEKFYQRLPKPYQAAIRHAAFVAAREEREQSIREGEEVKRECPEQGVHLAALTPQERQEFIKLTKPLYAKFSRRFGRELVEGIQETK